MEEKEFTVGISLVAMPNQEKDIGDMLAEDIKWFASEYGDNLYAELLKVVTDNIYSLELAIQRESIIPYDFAKQLQLYDIILPECFTSNDPLTTKLLKFMDDAEICFILYRRWHIGLNKIELDLAYTYIGNLNDFYDQIVKRTWK